MSGHDDRRFEEQLAALGRYVPTEEASRTALEAARRAVSEVRLARQRKRSFWMKMTIPSGIAAAVVAAAVLLTVPWERTVNAADDFAAVVEATQGYKGWVHWTYTRSAAVLSNGGGPAWKRMEQHSNAKLGVLAQVMEMGDDLKVNIVWTARREAASYSQMGREILYVSLSDQAVVSAPPVTFSEVVTRMNQFLGREPVSVKEAADGEVTRFDVVLFKTDEELAAFRRSKGERNALPRGFSVWVNKEKLVTRFHVDIGAGQGWDMNPTDAMVTYGGPEIKDIYDLGVPRDAKVTDLRLGEVTSRGTDGVLTKIGAALETRRREGIGDSVALLSSQLLDATRRNVEMGPGDVTLYMTKGDKWVANRYVLFLPANTRSSSVKAVLPAKPEGWPAPEVRTLLPALKAAEPVVSCVVDGAHAWYGSQGANGRLSFNVVTRAENGELLDQMALASQIWPGNEKTGIGVGKIDTAMQPGNSVRLRYKGETKALNGDEAVFETTYTLDLGKNYLPQEWHRNVVTKDRSELAERVLVYYSGYGELPGGRMYPTEWTETQMRRNMVTGDENTTVRRFRLQIWQGIEVEDAWFNVAGDGG